MTKELIIAKLTGKLEAYEKMLVSSKGKTKNDLTIKIETIKECLSVVRG